MTNDIDLQLLTEEERELELQARLWLKSTKHTHFLSPKLVGIIANTIVDLVRVRQELKAERERSAALVEAATPVEKWLAWWLSQDECECDGIHTCGKIERTRELEALHAALSNQPLIDGEEK